MASKKEQKRQRNLVLGILAVILIIGGLFAFGIAQEALGGFQTLSISDVQVEGDGDRIIVTGVAGTGGDNLRIDFSEEDLTSQLRTQGFRATEDVSGQITLESQEVEFPIRNPRTSEQFVALDQRDFGGTFGIGDCPSVTGFQLVGEISTSVFDSNKCLYRAGQGLSAEFSGERITRSEVSVELEGFSETLRPADGQNTINLGSNQITWSGSLSNFREINTPQYDVLFRDNVAEFLIADGAYSQFQNSKSDFINNINAERVADVFENTEDIPTSPAPRASDVENAVSTFNSELRDQILNNRNSEYENSIPGNIEFRGQSLFVDADAPVQYPQITLTLDADTVGIERLEGNPEITSVPEVNVDSGETEQAQIQVRNSGDAAGQFTLSASCNQGFSATGSSAFFESGDSGTMTLSITGTNTGDSTASSSCSLSLEDQNSGRTDTATLSGTIQPVEESEQDAPIPEPNETDGDEPSPGLQPGDCPFGQKFVQTEKEVGTGPFGIGKLVGSTETETVSECENRTWLNIVIIAGVLAVLLGILWLIRKFSPTSVVARQVKKVAG